MLSQASRVTGLGLAAVLGAICLVPACDSGGSGDGDDNKGGGGAGGNSAVTAGTAGSGAGSGGTAGSAAGTAGAGGAGQEVVACPGVVPDTALITDFAVAPSTGGKLEWGSAAQGDMDFWGGTFNYPTALELAVVDGALTASGSVTEYAGFGLYVQNCADASSFEGVRFKISGNPPMGKMRFALQTNKNEWATGMKGSCLADDAKKFIDCVHPGVAIDVTEDGATVEVVWADLGAGKPAAAATTDGSDIIGLQWILPWTETAMPYDVSIAIDDVELIGEGGGVGGAGPGPGGGGAGGSP